MSNNIKTIADVGESYIIGLIEETTGGSLKADIGIGDDAAAVGFSEGEKVLLTTDAMVENVHFRSGRFPFECLGYKALVSNISDIAAMGGTARYFLLSLGMPPTFSLASLEEMARGFSAASNEYSVELVGGNLSSSETLFINITMVGSARSGSIIKRDGARVGDRIFVTGTVGDSAAGLYMLENFASCTGGYLVDRHLKPKARTKEGLYLSQNSIASSMIDISDGISSDLDRICRASNVTAFIDTARLPLSRELQNTEGLPDAVWLAMNGGEDYELLFTASKEKICKLKCLQVTEIGAIIRGGYSGKAESVPGGFDHFKVQY